MRTYSKSIAILAFIILCFSLMSACGLEPFECALLVNENSQDSLELANFYAKARSVPDENVIYLDLPSSVLEPPYRMNSENFHGIIRDPVLAAIEQRGLSGQIRAWIYSCGFPTQVAAADGAILSLQGMTLCGQNTPSLNEVKSAGYRSPLYAGPGPNKEQLSPSRSFNRSIAESDLGQLVPSMMLSFTGQRGLSMAESKAVIRLGVLADGSAPNGTVYFVKTEDVSRSKPREWQFQPASNLLRRSGIEAVVQDQMPKAAKDIIGLQVGAKSPNPKSVGRFRAGAMAEHLTSWGARFDTPWHTKATDWLKAGATASAGTVTEPFALWPKFPTAFFYYHYRAGCTIMESFFQSVRSPVQLLLLGEPLARPWIRVIRLTLISLKDGPESGEADFYARLMVPMGTRVKPPISFYIGGQTISRRTRDGHCRVDTSTLPDGYHLLQAVLETDGEVNVRPQATLAFISDNRGRVPLLHGVSGGQTLRHGESFSVQVSAEDDPLQVGVRSRRRLLAVADGSTATFQIDTSTTGAEHVPLQAFAKYSDGETTLGKRIEIEVVRAAETENPVEENDG